MNKDKNYLMHLLKQSAELTENLERKGMTWQEDVAGKKMIHETYCEIYGRAKERQRTDTASESDAVWSTDKTAEKLNVSFGGLREDIQLAKAIEVNPKLKEYPTKAGAFRAMKKEEKIKQRIEIIKETKKEFKNLIMGDCAEELKKLPDKSVDCVVTDPPYGIDYIERTNSGGERGGQIYSINKNFPDSKEYAIDILDKACKELHRICKDNAHLYFFFGMSNYSEFRSVLEKYFIIDKIPLIWIKSNFPIGRDLNKNWALMYEPLFFCKNKNADRLLNGNVNKNVFNFNIVSGKGHPTEKPVDLLKYLIEVSTLEGEVILDPFAGSGSTCVAAELSKRKWIGIEREKEYYDYALTKIGEVK